MKPKRDMIMKKMILTIALLFSTVPMWAQQTPASGEVSQWLTEFEGVNINGPFNIVFEQIAETEAPRIVFDVKGSYTSRFQYVVKNKVLHVTERTESKRTSVTDVKVYYNKLYSIQISGATATFNTPVKGVMIGMMVGAGAMVTVPVEVTDLKVDLTGKSRMILSGSARYLQLSISTGKVDARELESMSIMAEASNGGEAIVSPTERLGAKVITNGRVCYTGNPIIRASTNITGGEIIHIE